MQRGVLCQGPSCFCEKQVSFSLSLPKTREKAAGGSGVLLFHRHPGLLCGGCTGARNEGGAGVSRRGGGTEWAEQRKCRGKALGHEGT